MAHALISLRTIRVFLSHQIVIMDILYSTRKVKVLSLPETIQEKIDVSSEGPSSGVSSGGQGKTTRVFIRVNTKKSRDKIKANQMDFIKTK